MRVAMDELQLHDLQNIEATEEGQHTCEMMSLVSWEIPAVDVQQNARPATADEPIVPNTPARGKDTRAPILVSYGRFSQE
jgi:hypothetical protein